MCFVMHVSEGDWFLLFVADFIVSLYFEDGDRKSTICVKFGCTKAVPNCLKLKLL